MITNMNWFRDRAKDKSRDVDEISSDLNHVVRHYPEYEVRITYGSLYGTICLGIYKKDEHIKSWIGMSLKKRVQQALDFMIEELSKK